MAIDPFSPAHALYGTGATVWATHDLTNADAKKATHWLVGAACERLSMPDYVAIGARNVRYSLPLDNTAHAIRASLFYGHNQYIFGGSCLERAHPLAHLNAVLLGIQHHRACSVNQNLTQVLVAAVTDPTIALPPVECCLGTRPIHAANSRPL